jgi:hypothetical protein
VRVQHAGIARLLLTNVGAADQALGVLVESLSDHAFVIRGAINGQDGGCDRSNERRARWT